MNRTLGDMEIPSGMLLCKTDPGRPCDSGELGLCHCLLLPITTGHSAFIPAAARQVRARASESDARSTLMEHTGHRMGFRGFCLCGPWGSAPLLPVCAITTALIHGALWPSVPSEWRGCSLEGLRQN